ncbi:MAG: DUF1127 domain-containing protein [Pseudolabrys sp.]
MSQQTNPIELASSTQLMRWARQERTALMASYLQRAAIGIAASLGDCVRYFGKLVRGAAHELYLRNATRTLQQFDDRILADIGLRRAEIEHAVRNGRSGNCARKGSPIFEPRRCDRHEAEKKVKATNTLALTQCANFFAPFLRRKPTM